MRWIFLLLMSPLLAGAAEFNDTDFSQAVNATKAKNARLVIYAWSPINEPSGASDTVR